MISLPHLRMSMGLGNGLQCCLRAQIFYSAAAAEAGKRAQAGDRPMYCFNVTIKAHYLYHLGEEAALLHPYLSCCAMDPTVLFLNRCYNEGNKLLHKL